MFWSKIWFFLVATAAGLGIGIALTMPRPAERKVLESEDERLTRARWGAEMLLRENAREWIDLASDFARAPAPAAQPRLKLDAVLDEASRSERISDVQHATTRDTLTYILSQVSGAQKPELAVALDKWGRVVASLGANDKVVGEDLSAYFLVADALRGYLRDDLWFENGKLYRMAAAPVIDRQRNDYVGAVVLGDEVDLPLAKALEERVGAHVAFFVKGEAVAKSDTAPIDQDIAAEFERRKTELDAKDAQGRSIPLKPFTVVSGERTYQVAIKRLPGAAGAQDGFFAVYAERPRAVGFLGTLRGVTKDDIGWSRFPWIPVGLLFVLSIVVGMVLMWLESERPLRALVEDAIRLGKGESQKLEEERHRGKFGSIARSVNIALEKLSRGKARKDLGAVLGPAPDELGLDGGPAIASKPAPMGGAFAPPPADFSFEPPVAGAPLNLGVADTPSLADFGLAPPPPPSAPPPPPAVAALPRKMTPPPVAPPVVPPVAPTPPMPAIDAIKTAPVPPRAAAARPPAGSPPPAFRDVRTPAPPPVAPRAPAPTSSIVVPTLDDDLLAPNLDEEMLAGGTEPPMRKKSPSAGDFGGATIVADPSEDLLRQSAEGGESGYFRQIYEEFVELKRKCGESVDGLTYEKFEGKLRQNRDQLIDKYGCKSVKFQVYVKDGKAALKATPVKA